MSAKRAIGLVAGGALGGGLVAAALTPALARIFTPADLGVLTLFTAIAATLAVVANMRFELALGLPSTRVGQATLFLAGVGVCLAVSASTGLGAGLYGYAPPGVPVAAWALGLAASVGAHGLYELGNRWALAEDRASQAAVAKLVQTAGTPVLQIALGLALGASVAALIAGYVIGKAASAVIVQNVALRAGAEPLRHAIKRPRRILRAMAIYRRFPLFSAPASFLNGFSARAVVFFLGFFATLEQTGLYGIAFLLVVTPVLTFSQAVMQVFLAQGGDLRRSRGLGKAFEGMSRTLLSFGLPAAAICATVAPSAFALVLGEQWRDAGVIAQMMSPMLLAVCVSAPASMMPSLAGRPQIEFGFNIGLLVARLAALAVGAVQGDFWLGLACYFAVSTAAFLLNFLIGSRLAGTSAIAIVVSVWPFALLALAAAAAIATAKAWAAPELTDLAAVAAAAPFAAVLAFIAARAFLARPR